jgi:hypothetical protein
MCSFDAGASILYDAWLLQITDPSGSSPTATWTQLTVLSHGLQPFLAFAGSTALSDASAVSFGGIAYPTSALNLGQVFPAVSTAVFVWSFDVTNTHGTVSVSKQDILNFSLSLSGRVACSTFVIDRALVIFGGLDVFASFTENHLMAVPLLTNSSSLWLEIKPNNEPQTAVFGSFVALPVDSNSHETHLISFGGQSIRYPRSGYLWHFDDSNGKQVRH